MRRFAFAVTILLGVAAVAPLALRAQDPGAARTPRARRPVPTHAPRPRLSPAEVLHHAREGNAAAVRARAAEEPAPPPRPRPAGAGRYLCAVFVCADADLDVPVLLGLARRDVLVLSSPGPFVEPEAVAVLEHCAAEERLPLVIVLSHPRCLTTAVQATTPRQTALAERIAELRRRARRSGDPLPRALARAQREALLAASELLQHSVAADRLRVVPAEVDASTLQITWHTTQADEMPIAPVK